MTQVTLDALDRDPYALLAELRDREPVAWVPALDGWLITRRDLALAAMRDAATFTVDDPRFTTAQVVGPMMLSLDGPEHARHRTPFVAPFRLAETRGRLAGAVRGETAALLEGLAPRGAAELRTAFAGPLAAAVVTRALGLDHAAAGTVLGWYAEIVGAVTDLSGGRPARPGAQAAVRDLGEAVTAAIGGGPLAAAGATLSAGEVASNAAVVLFGGIETTEGMIASALVHLLSDPAALAWVREDPERLAGAIEESLRLEPAAAVVDRYATRDVALGGARIAAGDLVRISITAANRDPAAFPEPDRFDPGRPDARRHLAFASGPHVCIGMHLARLEAVHAVRAILDLPGIRLDPGRPSPAMRGLVFRKPDAVEAVWDPASA